MHRDQHDEFGGLHRDLLQTGVTIDRRELLRRAATFGISVAGLQLPGCSNSTGTNDGGDGIATAWDGTRFTRQARRTRTTCAACRRQTPAGR